MRQPQRTTWEQVTIWRFAPSQLLRLPPLDSGTEWTGDLQLKTVFQKNVFNAQTKAFGFLNGVNWRLLVKLVFINSKLKRICF